MKYSMKLLISPVKWVCCLLFVAVIPIAMYVPTYFDFINVCTFYIPFVAVVLFTDITLIDKANQMEEIVYVSHRKPVASFVQRLVFVVLLLLAFLLLANGIFRVYQSLNGESMVEHLTLAQYFVIVGGSCLYIGLLSMTISTITSNPYVGYGFSIVFWIYWNVNAEIESIINPFPFIANPTFYEKPLLTIYIIAGILFVINCLLIRKSPYLMSEKMRKLLVLGTSQFNKKGEQK